MNFIPNNKRVLLKMVEEERTTEGGFILVSKEKSDVASAKVIKVSHDVELNLNGGLIGITAYFKESDALKICIEGENYLIIDNEKILGFT